MPDKKNDTGGQKYIPPFGAAFVISYSLCLNWHKCVFAESAERAYPILRNILKCCSRCDTAIRIALLRVIYIATWFTKIFLHFVILLSKQ